MAEALTVENLKTIAEQRGLKLADEELQQLLPGVMRARQQAAELRALLTLPDEPAGVFNAGKEKLK
ncbi:MAG: hypothetical protein ACXW4O_12375 [Candidatus Binatia bacterium]